MTLTVGDESLVLRPQSSAVVPRSVPHRYVVTSETDARWLVLTVPGRFDAFVTELSRPAEANVAPPPHEGPPTPAEIEHLAAVAARHGIEILA